MISLLVYLVGTVLTAGVLSFLSGMARPVAGRAEGRGVRGVFLWLVLCVGGPFAWVEFQTSKHYDELKPATLDAYEESPLEGPLLYSKVLSSNGSTAKILMVGEETEGIGFTDRPVLAVDLIKGSRGWEVQNTKVLHSQRLNTDEFIFPPYR